MRTPTIIESIRIDYNEFFCKIDKNKMGIPSVMLISAIWLTQRCQEIFIPKFNNIYKQIDNIKRLSDENQNNT